MLQIQLNEGRRRIMYVLCLVFNLPAKKKKKSRNRSSKLCYMSHVPLTNWPLILFYQHKCHTDPQTQVVLGQKCQHPAAAKDTTQVWPTRRSSLRLAWWLMRWDSQFTQRLHAKWRSSCDQPQELAQDAIKGDTNPRCTWPHIQPSAIMVLR